MRESAKVLSLDVVLAGFLSFGAMAQTGPENCKLVSYASLNMRTLADGRVTVPLRLGDRETYFLVDTGGIVSTINSRVARKMNLERRTSNINLMFLGRTAVMKETVRIEDFSVGLMHGKDLKFYVDPSNSTDWAGTLAPNLLGNFDLDFDFYADKLNLISKNPCPGVSVYWTKDPVAVVPITVGKDGQIGIPVTVDGNKIFALIDTGAEESFISASFALNVMHIDPKDSRIGRSSLTVNGGRTFSFPFQSINFEGVVVSNPNILIVNDSDLHDFKGDAVLGIGILRQLHMYISYKEGKMYLTAATAH